MKHTFLISVLTASLAISACSEVTSSAGTGAPRLPNPMLTKTDTGAYTWLNINSFGAVPDSAYAAGLKMCQREVGPNSVPVGYHPSPVGMNAQPTGDQGFLCSY